MICKCMYCKHHLNFLSPSHVWSHWINHNAAWENLRSLSPVLTSQWGLWRLPLLCTCLKPSKMTLLFRSITAARWQQWSGWLSTADKPFKFESIFLTAGRLDDYICENNFFGFTERYAWESRHLGQLVHPGPCLGEEVTESTCLLCCRPCGALHKQVKIPAVLGTGKVSRGDCVVSGMCLRLACQLWPREQRGKVAGMCQDPAPQGMGSTKEPSSLHCWWVSHALE